MDSSTDHNIIAGCGGKRRHGFALVAAAFFGTAENHGLCSKCYKDSSSAAANAEREDIDDEAIEPSPVNSSTDHNGVIGCDGSRQSQNTPLSVPVDAAFYGSPENRGFCTMCYMDYLQQTTSSQAKSEAATLIKDRISDNIPITEEDIDQLADALKSATIVGADVTDRAVKKRCGICNKKLGLLGFECRCGGSFCGAHRHPETHPCKLDFKEAGKIAINKENPVCEADKMADRI